MLFPKFWDGRLTNVFFLSKCQKKLLGRQFATFFIGSVGLPETIFFLDLIWRLALEVIIVFISSTSQDVMY